MTKKINLSILQAQTCKKNRILFGAEFFLTGNVCFYYTKS